MFGETNPQSRKEEFRKLEEARKQKRREEIDQKILGSTRDVNSSFIMQSLNYLRVREGKNSLRNSDFANNGGMNSGRVTFLSYDEEKDKFRVNLEYDLKTGSESVEIVCLISDIRN